MICAACGSDLNTLWAVATDIEYFSTDEKFSYHKCHSCDALTIDPIPADQLSTIYPENYYSYDHQKKSMVTSVKEFLDKLFYKKILAKINSEFINVIDVGGGNGSTLSLLKKIDGRIKKTTVVDLNEKSKRIAESGGHDFQLGRFEEFSTNQKSQLILMLNLIEHVSDPRAVLAKAENLLSDEGLILIQTPNYKSIDARIFRNFSWGGFHCPRHWVIFDKKSFSQLCDAASLEIVDFKYIQGAPFWTWSIMNVLRKLKMVRYNKNHLVVSHRITPALMAFFATVDIIRGVFFKTSQMVFLLKKKSIERA